MGTGGQHRDDRLGILGRLLGRADGQASFLLRAIERVLREIEGVHVMALFREIGRHPAAHVAEPDETDACHVFSPHLPSSPAGGECYFPVDRKSGVWGKSVSVRVYLGGRRIFKKKNY